MTKKLIEIIPAILVKTREELLAKISKVKPYAKTIQLDIMDGKFVPNTTIGINELKGLPQELNYELHWMVRNPDSLIRDIREKYLHLIHVEAIRSVDWTIDAMQKSGGRIGLAINPTTHPEEKLFQLVEEFGNIERILVMMVKPGFSAQNYIPEAEEIIKAIKNRFPKIEIEVDGGINKNTIARAFHAGATKFAVANAIFSAESVGEAIRELKQVVEEERYK